MKRNAWQNTLLHWQLGKLNINTEVKEELVYTVTKGREKSTKELTFEECNTLIGNLNVMLAERGIIKPKRNPVREVGNTDPENRMRRKIISICHEMRWKLENGKIDMARVNGFCLDRGYLHKALDAYTRAELPKLITQFEKVLKDFYAEG